MACSSKGICAVLGFPADASTVETALFAGVLLFLGVAVILAVAWRSRPSRPAILAAVASCSTGYAIWPRKFRESLDCRQLVSRPLNQSPQRSPQAVHTVLLSHFAGKDLVEIGTHHGDGMACFSQRTKTAVAFELDGASCNILHSRSQALALEDKGGFEVHCNSYQGALSDADAVTWWREYPLTNEGILDELLVMQQRGRLRPGAMAYPLFDNKWPSDMSSWAALQHLASWHTNVTFDECNEVHQDASAWQRLGAAMKIVRLLRRVLFPSTQNAELSGGRCRGTFTVAAIPVQAWAGQQRSSLLGVSSPTPDVGHSHSHVRVRHRPPACTVHRGAVLHFGRLWNVTTMLKGSRPDAGWQQKSLTSPFFGKARISITAEPLPAHAPRCERVERGVIAAVSGGYGCAQLAHYLFNFLLPQWDAIEQLGWAPLPTAPFRPPAPYKPQASLGPHSSPFTSYVLPSTLHSHSHPSRARPRLHPSPHPRPHPVSLALTRPTFDSFSTAVAITPPA